MDRDDIDRVAAWLADRGLAGDSELPLLQGFCERCVEAGLALSRAVAIIDTLHPVYEGRAFFWDSDRPLASPVSEYGPSDDSSYSEEWQRSPFYYLLQSEDTELRRRLDAGETDDFPLLAELRAEGQTDYFAIIQRFNREAAIGEMDCFMSRWSTAQAGGFSDADLAALRRLVD